ncbi:methyl-accepting chemotaxis protein [uncultured Photobacterium sp.]|uniref:methyl-accepting chemotaxis protein n=1 Tax=uncultured Photobacterium sp. TaxID=173973 RepID=UPI002622B8A6|nr:methyl-accepting chemotaxis protein [uncultured Photobacterium sp.]
MNSLGFKKTIILSVALLVAASLLASNWFAYLSLKESTIRSVNDKSMSILSYEAEKVETWFSNKAQAIQSVADNYDSGLTAEIFVKLAKLTADGSGFSYIVFGLDDGRAFMNESDDVWVHGVADTERYDPRVRPWYKLGQRSDSLAVTDIYTDSGTGEKLISIVKRVSNGVVLGDIELSILNKAVQNVNFPGAVTSIVDESGMALASNSPVLKVGVRLDSLGMADVQKAMVSNHEFTIPYTLNGVNKVAFTRTIELVNGKRWYLFIGVDESIAYAEVDKALTHAIFTSLGMLFVGIVLVVVILNFLYRPILSLKEMVTDLSQGNGDLTRRLLVTSDDDLGQISQGINAFIANLQTLMRDVSQASQHISHSVDHLKMQTEVNHKVLTAHTSETDQVVAAVEEMSATAGDVANNAAEASQFTHKTNAQVVDSKVVVTNATKTVSQLVDEVENTAHSITAIEKDTLEITNVLNVIGEIAEQTNLLALNAAIEAARAGEQGRGFAVVADEVRALAARTQESTGEIEQTLNNLRNGSNDAISAMDTTKSTCEKSAETTSLVASDLDSIAQSVTHINDLNTQIATAAEQQSSVAGEITRNMNEIREIVSKLSQNEEATLNETLSLAAANSQLISVVGKFKL